MTTATTERLSIKKLFTALASKGVGRGIFNTWRYPLFTHIFLTGGEHFVGPGFSYTCVRVKSGTFARELVINKHVRFWKSYLYMLSLGFEPEPHVWEAGIQDYFLEIRSGYIIINQLSDHCNSAIYSYRYSSHSSSTQWYTVFFNPTNKAILNGTFRVLCSNLYKKIYIKS